MEHYGKRPQRFSEIISKLWWLMLLIVIFLLSNQFFSWNCHVANAICSVVIIYCSYCAIFGGGRTKFELTLWYFALICAFFSIVPSIYLGYVRLLQNPCINHIVDMIARKLQSLNSGSIDTMTKVVVSITMLMFCKDMLSWSESVPMNEYNCYRVKELHLNYRTVIVVLSEYFFFFSYWIHGYKTYMLPLVILTLFITVSQMVLLNYTGWEEKTLLRRAAKFVFSEVSSKKKPMDYCKHIIKIQGRAYAENEKESIGYRRKEFQKELLNSIISESKERNLQDNHQILWSIGMACKVYYHQEEKSEIEKTKLIMKQIDASTIESKYKYHIKVGVLCGHLLNQTGKSIVLDEQLQSRAGGPGSRMVVDLKDKYEKLIEELVKTGHEDFGKDVDKKKIGHVIDLALSEKHFSAYNAFARVKNRDALELHPNDVKCFKELAAVYDKEREVFF